MTVILTDEYTGGMLSYEITGVASADNAGQGSIANPFGCSVNIIRAYLVPSVVSAGAANLSIGIAAVAGAGTDILNAAAMAAVNIGRPINCFANDPNAMTVTAPAIWTTALFLTFTASATLVGFVGTLYIEALRTTVANA